MFFVNNITEDHKKSSGIYEIRNKLNNKVYVGKTVNFSRRYTAYKGGFKKQDVRKINQRFLNSINKYGPENFTFSVIEACPVELLAERELAWMEYFESTNPEKGYNLRMDSSTGMVTHPSTSKKISTRIKKEYDTGVRSREAISIWATALWEDGDKKEQMARSVSKAKASFFIQRTMEGEPIAVWSNINQIIEHNPGYKWQNIYAACNGNKASYMKSKWERTASVHAELQHLLIEYDFSIINRKGEDGFFDQAGAPNKAEYTYLVERGGKVYEILGGAIQDFYSNVYCAFYRKKSDVIRYGEYTITRTPFIASESKSVEHYRQELERLLETVASINEALLIDKINWNTPTNME
jgi:group I intron endonuclease